MVNFLSKSCIHDLPIQYIPIFNNFKPISISVPVMPVMPVAQCIAQ